MGKNIFGFCRLCGEYKKLSREHFPPKGAYNSGQFKLVSINQYKTQKSLVWHEKWRDGGNARYTTCEGCNTKTGGWYGKSYIAFARACEPYARPDKAGRIGYIPMAPFYPARVVKQVVCSILAASQTEYESGRMGTVCAPSRALFGPPPTERMRDLSSAFRVLPALREFALNPRVKGLPEGVSLYFYLVANLKGRSTGFGIVGREDTRTHAVMSEFAWFPLGWVLLCDGVLEEPLRDVSAWAEYDYDYQRALNHLSVSCQWAEGGPLDFHSPEELANISIQNQFFANGIGRRS